MARKGGSKEGLSHDSSMTMPSEQKSMESNKMKISRIREVFPTCTKDHIAKILQFYDDDEFKAMDAITRDGGCEALSHFAEAGSSKNKKKRTKRKNNKSKKESGLSTTASFDADDSSSLHSSGNVDADIEKECHIENGNGFFPDATEELDNLNATLTNHERLQNTEEEPLSLDLETRSAISTPDQEIDQKSSVSCSEKLNAHTSYDKSNSSPHKQANENTSCASPSYDKSEKLEEPEPRRDRSRPSSEHYKHTQRQRNSSFRRSKTSSLSEDSSSQHNTQSLAAKRGIDRCRKDLNRQTTSLQRIHSQVERCLDESAKKIKSVFGELQKQIENRRKEIELELEQRKVEALNLIKSRQDLGSELKRRIDRSPSMTDAEWNELRSDIKLFVTERKYDEDLGKTIWFQWTDMSESIRSFGEVQPVKNSYSQRSTSTVLANSESSQDSNIIEPSPSSLSNKNVDHPTETDDVAHSNTGDEEIQSSAKEDEAFAVKSKPNEGRTYQRIYSNSTKRYPRFNGSFQNNRAPFRGQRFQRSYNSRPNYMNYNNNRYPNEDYRSHSYQERDGRTNDNQNYSGIDRNMNSYYRDKNNTGRKGHNPNSGYHQHYRYPKHNRPNANATTTSTVEPPTKSAESNVGKPNVMNGVENN